MRENCERSGLFNAITHRMWYIDCVATSILNQSSFELAKLPDRSIMRCSYPCVPLASNGSSWAAKDKFRHKLRDLGCKSSRSHCIKFAHDTLLIFELYYKYNISNVVVQHRVPRSTGPTAPHILSTTLDYNYGFLLNATSHINVITICDF